MKCMTLAVAVLFVVGCQAAPMQADEPAPLQAYLQQARTAGLTYLELVKNYVHNQLDLLENAEKKQTAKNMLEVVYSKITEKQRELQPMTDSALQTIDEATRSVRSDIHADITTLHQDLESLLTQLREAVTKHVEDYKSSLQPLIDEYRPQQPQIDSFKSKLDPIVAELKSKFAQNSQDTQGILSQIVAKIGEKLTERAQSINVMVQPYVEEYREQLKNFYQPLAEIPPHELREKIQPHLETVAAGFQGIVSEIQAMKGQ